MKKMNSRRGFRWRAITLVLAVFWAVVSICHSAQDGPNVLANKELKVFDGRRKVIVVNGYSTSFAWPGILQKKLDHYFGGKRLITVKSAVRGGTAIAGWIDVKSGEPRQPWLAVLRPILRESEGIPVIVLAQQSLQWVFGQRSEGIRDTSDRVRIQQGADAMEKYVRLLKKEGAELVFVATHIYKYSMEPEIGNERYALQELMQRKIPGLKHGPDVWTATKKFFPRAFAEDRKHPSTLGSEVMAQQWFETLLRYDGLEVPAWSKASRRRADAGRRQRRLPVGVRVLRDVEYIPGGHERHKLDLYLHQKAGDESEGGKKRALIVWVHGGAWRAGDKSRCPAIRYVGKGYIVASINYRLSQHAIFPAQIEDCKSAIRWLRANANKYGIDANRIGVWGSSAGGHLAALLGTTGDVKVFEKGENLGFSSRVQAVCDFYGPTDFVQMSRYPSRMDHDAADSPESKLIGGPIQENKKACQRANPISYLSKDDPPFLIVHGDKDPLVPHNQSQLLYEALKEAGVSARLYTVKGGGHGGFKDPELDKLVERFFERHLKGGTEDGKAGANLPTARDG